MSSLHLLVQWYNNVKSMLEVERPLIKSELQTVDLLLVKAETSLTWQDQDCWGFIKTTKHRVRDLAQRVSRAKENCDAIQSVMTRWSKNVMFCRKDNKKGSPIQLDDRTDYVKKMYSSMKKDGDFIHQLLKVCKAAYILYLLHAVCEQ